MSYCSRSFNSNRAIELDKLTFLTKLNIKSPTVVPTSQHCTYIMTNGVAKKRDWHQNFKWYFTESDEDVVFKDLRTESYWSKFITSCIFLANFVARKTRQHFTTPLWILILGHISDRLFGLHFCRRCIINFILNIRKWKWISIIK